ncbi:hypothetical protein H632_c1514p1 [Helicosporidium sp. ATCC 50920]|nr:hypothetical protein H632_c1514p1 [Helicosporidium sp. ATCC 50920]|eukprot:KDD74169.1 hypothetical protein H632_c1514p1 [Helicosporidium sp. ATCC 50920]
MDIPPNHTIYLRNVYDKLKKDETQRLLYALFGQFGRILDVVVMSGVRLRGQAWIAFSDVGAATNALRAMQNFPFYGKPLRVEFSANKSKIVTETFGIKPGKKQLGASTGPRVEPEAPAAAPSGPQPSTPSSVLFVEGLPAATTEAMLSLLFQQYPGFAEIRMVEARPGIAFVEYASEAQAEVALSGLDGFRVDGHALSISFAKR